MDKEQKFAFIAVLERQINYLESHHPTHGVRPEVQKILLDECEPELIR